MHTTILQFLLAASPKLSRLDTHSNEITPAAWLLYHSKSQLFFKRRNANTGAGCHGI